MHDDRLQILLQRYCDQMLTLPERLELEHMLLSSSHAREQFWQFARWNALLRQWGEAEWGRFDADVANTTLRPKAPAPAKTKTPPRQSRLIRLWPVAVGIALLFVVALVYHFSIRDSQV